MMTDVMMDVLVDVMTDVSASQRHVYFDILELLGTFPPRIAEVKALSKFNPI